MNIEIMSEYIRGFYVIFQSYNQLAALSYTFADNV